MSDACPHCGHETGADVCPLCGSRVAAPEGAPGREGDSPRGRGDREGALPWEDPAVPFPENLWRTWKGSLFAPSDFFRRVTEERPFARALLYFLLAVVAGAVFTLAWQSWLTSAAVYTGGVPGVEPAAGPAFSFFLAPFMALIGLAVATAVYHLGALVLAPERRGIGATARVLCYAAGPSVLAVIPFVGSIVGAVWTVVLQVVGLREVHRTTTPRALAMVFWLWVAFFFLLAAVVALAMVAGVEEGVWALPSTASALPVPGN